jgi:NAD(P)H dehydrogenase (quinone)
MQIGISGASGQLGQATLAALAAKPGGHRIIGISRTPDKIAAPAEARFGDFDQPESLAAAYAGLDRLLIIPTSDIRPGVRGSQNLTAIDAAVKAGVGQVAFMSSAGTRDVEEPGVWASYFAGEQRLMQTAAKWSILRMNYYAEALLQEVPGALGSGVLTGLAENRVAFVSRADIAAAAAGLLTGSGHEGAIYNATGPASLSGAERAALISRASGKPVGFMTLPEAQLRGAMEQMGYPADVVNVVISIQQGFAAGGFDIVTGDVEMLSGQAPRALDDILAVNLPA